MVRSEDSELGVATIQHHGKLPGRPGGGGEPSQGLWVPPPYTVIFPQAPPRFKAPSTRFIWFGFGFVLSETEPLYVFQGVLELSRKSIRLPPPPKLCATTPTLHPV